MSDKNYTASITVPNTADEMYKAINNVRGWWSKDIEGKTDEVGSVFYYHYKDFHHCTIKVAELTPGKKVVWQILHNSFSSPEFQGEWLNSSVVFEITSKGGETELQFTHIGLTPADACYEACSDGWGTYIKSSLKDLITTGKGEPNEGEPRTESEEKLTNGEEL